MASPRFFERWRARREREAAAANGEKPVAKVYMGAVVPAAERRARRSRHDGGRDIEAAHPVDEPLHFPAHDAEDDFSSGGFP